jgi:hypothetical protein
MGATDILHYFTNKDTGDAVTAGSTASSNIINFGRTKPQIGVGQLPLTLIIRTVVAGGGSGNINFILRKSATQSAGALSGTITQILATPIVAQNDARLATAGNFVIRVGVAYELDQQYADVYAVLSGSATITYEAVLAEAPSDKHTQVMESDVGNP